MSFQAAPGQDSVVIGSRREHLPEAIALAAERLRRPAFSADAFDESKRQSRTRIGLRRRFQTVGQRGGWRIERPVRPGVRCFKAVIGP